jgi:hypothetical protein
MEWMLGWFMLGTWITMVWLAVKLVQDARASVREWRHPHGLARH